MTDSPMPREISERIHKMRHDLGRSLDGVKKIYLDTKFWLILRDCELGRIRDPVAHELLTLLRLGKKDKRLICPAEQTVIMEVMRQTDTATRLKTARLIDQLSSGVVIQPIQERLTEELGGLIYRSTGRSDQPTRHFVWTKMGFSFGEMFPNDEWLPSNLQEDLRNYMLDQMWNAKLEDMLTDIEAAPWTKNAYDEMADKLNKGIHDHAHEAKSYSATYRSELHGSIRGQHSQIADVMSAAYFDDYGVAPDTSSITSDDLERHLAFIAEIALQKEEVKRDLPTSHIQALCHAAHRMEKTRDLTGNDILDFHHASAAIGYCDAFFTEKALANLLTQPRFEIEKVFGCSIISRVSKAVEWLYQF